jgi:hypothetical protein
VSNLVAEADCLVEVQNPEEVVDCLATEDYQEEVEAV